MKMNYPIRFILLATFLGLATFVKGQLTLDYAFSTGSIESDFFGSFKVDQLGNYYMLGEYSDTTDMDPGPGEDLVTNGTTHPLVLTKFNTAGEYMHSSVFYGGSDIGGQITELKNGQLLVVVYFADKLTYTFQGNTAVLSEDAGRHACILHINLNGQILSNYIFEVPASFYFSNLYTLTDGSYIAAGSFQDTFSFGSGGGTSEIISRGDYDAFIAKLDPSFSPQWVRLFSSANEEYIEDIYLKEEEAIYFTLTHSNNLLITTSEGPKTFPSNGEDNNVYGKVAMNGTVEIAYGFGGELGDQVRSIVADADGNMYICGYFEGEVNFNKPTGTPDLHTSWNDTDGFVSKYTPDGTLAWTRIIRDSQYGGLYTMILARDNELYLSGSFSDTADLDPGPDSNMISSNYRGDIFIMKLTTAGDQKWVYPFPGNDFEGIRNVVLSNQGKVYVSGYFDDSLDCDITEDTLLFVSKGGSDVFVAAFSEEGVVNQTEDVIPLNTILYPNPVSAELQITCEKSIDDISCYAMDGMRISVPGIRNGDRARLNLSGLSEGMYFIKVSAGDQTSFSKIVKQ